MSGDAGEMGIESRPEIVIVPKDTKGADPQGAKVRGACFPSATPPDAGSAYPVHSRRRVVHNLPEISSLDL